MSKETARAAVAAAALAIVAVASGPAGAQERRIVEAFANSLTELPPGSPAVKGSTYVPVYSSVAMAGNLRVAFSVTLSIRNASETRPLIVSRIAYFDTAGQLVKTYLEEPVALRPFGTIEVSVPVNDVRGGSGANFIVDWASSTKIAEPVIEALMLGSLGNASYSFVSAGRRIELQGVN